MGIWKRAALVAIACLALAYSLTADAATSAQRGSVYLMRGFANVLSRGLDDLNAKLHRRGVNSTILSYTDEYAVAEAIEQRYAKGKGTLPVILIGHSFGADATLRVSARLAEKKIPVALIIDFDPVTDIAVSANVNRVINFYEPIGGLRLNPGRGFRGRLDNIDVSKSDPTIGHFNIEKNYQLHARAISAVLATLGR